MDKENKNGLLIAFIITLIIAVLGLGGTYYFYNKDTSPTKCVELNDNINELNILEDTSKDSSPSFYENMIKNRQVMVDYDHGITMVIDKDGNVYYSAQQIEKSIGTKGLYAIDNYMSGIDEDGKMSNVLDGYKLEVSNVVAMYHAFSGNGGYQNYILIKADGTIAKLTYYVIIKDNKTIVNIEKFEETVAGYKDIIGVLTSNSWDAHDYKLVDINGNIY